MQLVRKRHCRTGCPNAGKRRDARGRRSNYDVENALNGFFDRLPDQAIFRAQLAAGKDNTEHG